MLINHPARHSRPSINSGQATLRVGGNPVQLFNMQLGFVRYAESFFLLDSRLRGNDAGG